MEIIGLPQDCNSIHDACDDRVAQDLGIAYHKVGVEEYKKRVENGFSAKKEELEKTSKEERDRLMGLASGCALRKGSKHR